MITDLVPSQTAPLAFTSVGFDADILAGQLAPSSIAMYRRDFAAYLTYAGSAGLAMDPPTLARWRAELANKARLSPNTINRMLAAVKRLVREAAVQGYASSETAEAFALVKGVKVVAMKDQTKTHGRTKIEPEDMRRLCGLPDTSTAVGLRDAALLATMASSGLRVAEVASLTIGQILRKKNGYLVSVRGKNDLMFRDAPLSKEAYRLIMDWIAGRPVMSDYVFTSFAGRGKRATAVPLSTVSAWRIIQGYADRAGLAHVKPHDFRRFVGTQLAKKDIRKAQKALGHKRLETTARHYVLDELEPGLTDNLY
jgi:integrase/recombinase XerD